MELLSTPGLADGDTASMRAVGSPVVTTIRTHLAESDTHGSIPGLTSTQKQDQQ